MWFGSAWLFRNYSIITAVVILCITNYEVLCYYSFSFFKRSVNIYCCLSKSLANNQRGKWHTFFCWVLVLNVWTSMYLLTLVVNSSVNNLSSSKMANNLMLNVDNNIFVITLQWKNVWILIDRYFVFSFAKMSHFPLIGCSYCL